MVLREQSHNFMCSLFSANSYLPMVHTTHIQTQALLRQETLLSTNLPCLRSGERGHGGYEAAAGAVQPVV